MNKISKNQVSVYKFNEKFELNRIKQSIKLFKFHYKSSPSVFNSLFIKVLCGFEIPGISK
jgi:hypothetical protein